MTYFSEINVIRKTKVDSVMKLKKGELATRNICQAIETSNLLPLNYSPTLLRSIVALKDPESKCNTISVLFKEIYGKKKEG